MTFSVDWLVSSVHSSLGTLLNYGWETAEALAYTALDRTVFDTSDLVFDPSIRFSNIDVENADDLTQALLNVEHFLLLSIHYPKLCWDERKLEAELKKLEPFFPGFADKVYDVLDRSHPELERSVITKEAWRGNALEDGAQWATERLVAFRSVAEQELFATCRLSREETTFVATFNTTAFESPIPKESESSHYFPRVLRTLDGVLANRTEGNYETLYLSTWGETDRQKATQMSITGREWSSIGERAPLLVQAFVNLDALNANAQNPSHPIKPSSNIWEESLQELVDTSEEHITLEMLQENLPKVTSGPDPEEEDSPAEIDWNHSDTPRVLRQNMENCALQWARGKFPEVAIPDIHHRIYELAKDPYKESTREFGRIHCFRDWYTFFLAVEIAARKAEEESLICEKTSDFEADDSIIFTDDTTVLEDSYAGTNEDLVRIYAPLHELMRALEPGADDAIADSNDLLTLLNGMPIAGFTDRIIASITAEFRTNPEIVRHNLSARLFRESFIRAVNIAIGNYLVNQDHVTREELMQMQADVYEKSRDPHKHLNPDFGAHHLLSDGVETFYFEIDAMHNSRTRSFDEAEAKLVVQSAKEWRHIGENAGDLVHAAMRLRSLCVDDSKGCIVSTEEWLKTMKAVKAASKDEDEDEAALILVRDLLGELVTEEDDDETIQWDHSNFASIVNANLDRCLGSWLQARFPDIPLMKVHEMVYHLSKDPFKERDPHFGERYCFRDLPTFFLAVELCAREHTGYDLGSKHKGNWTPPIDEEIPAELPYQEEVFKLVYNPLRRLEDAIECLKTANVQDEEDASTSGVTQFPSSIQLREALEAIPICNFADHVIEIIASEFRCDPKFVRHNLSQRMFFSCLERAVSLALGHFFVDSEHLTALELEELRREIYGNSDYDHKEKEPDYGSTHFFDYTTLELYEAIFDIRDKRAAALIAASTTPPSQPEGVQSGQPAGEPGATAAASGSSPQPGHQEASPPPTPSDGES